MFYAERPQRQGGVKRVDICLETVRFWVERFGLKFVQGIRKNRAGQHLNWKWHLDEVFVKINGERFYL